MDRVREFRPDILIILGSPQEDPMVVYSKADMVLNTDDIGRGPQIAEAGLCHGCQSPSALLVPPPHVRRNAGQERELMKARAEELGMLFVDEDARPPMRCWRGGTQMFISEDVPQDCPVRPGYSCVWHQLRHAGTPLIAQTIANGGIFPQSSAAQALPRPSRSLRCGSAGGIAGATWNGSWLPLMKRLWKRYRGQELPPGRCR